MFRRGCLISFVASSLVVAMACGGGDDDESSTPGSTSAPTRTATMAASPVETSTKSAVSARPTLLPRTPGASFDDAEAAALLDYVLLKPDDLESGWVIQSDNTTDNAAAAQADPTQAASNDRCGRLLGRTITNFAPDVVSAFISGTTLALFSTGTVYRDEAGATDCSNESAAMLQQPGALARLFGGVFVDPAAVVVTPVEFPQVADGSFAATLTGKSNANGLEYDLTILVVAFRSGSVTSAVGSARAGSAPETSELAPYVELVADRIATSQ